MPICVDRERRPNAGSRMDKLLNEEDDDEFYTNVYGGFSEEADDIDYESESSVEDIIDSDFCGSSATDSESGASADEDRPRKRRTGAGVVTKAYREPKRQQPEKTTKPLAQSKEASSSQDKEPRVKRTRTEVATSDVNILEPRTLRKRANASKCEQESAKLSLTNVRREAMLAEIALRKNVPEVRRLTQEELLAEAKLTEEINRHSLIRYQRLEIERKKAHFPKVKESVPMIRYHSFAAPLIGEKPTVYGVQIDPETLKVRAGPLVPNSARCCRNLITFADSHNIRASFPQTATPLPEPTNPAPQPPRPQRRIQICPISGLPARYVDPVTRTPYANLAAFRVLRRLYQIHLETNTPAIELLREYRNSATA